MQTWIAQVSHDELAVLNQEWGLWAREKQLPPQGEWRIWLLLAGRGFGKTRAGAQWINEVARTQSDLQLALVGATFDDVRHVMVEGASGVLNCAPSWCQPRWYPSHHKLIWPNGSVARCFAAESPRQLRGPEFHFGWADEIAKWRYVEAWDNFMMALRCGERPQVLATTTPRPLGWLAALAKASDTALVTGCTSENQDNLSSGFMKAMQASYGNSALARQELYGELLAELPGALWNRSQLDALQAPMPERHHFIRIVIGVDPAIGGADITLSGSSKWTYEAWSDDDDNEGGANDNAFAINNDVTVAASLASDSGLTYGTSLTLDTGGGAVNDDGMKLFVSGGFGEIRTGSGTAGDSINMDVTGSVEGEKSSGAGSLRGDSVATGSDSSISYFTPTISGLSGAISFTDAGSDSKADSTEIGVKFSTEVGGNPLTLSYTQSNTAADGVAAVAAVEAVSDNVTIDFAAETFDFVEGKAAVEAAPGNGDKSAASYGVGYSIGALSLKVAVNSSSAEDANGNETSDASNAGFGLGYKVSDALKFGVYQVSGEDKVSDTDYSETAVSLTYTIAPGLSTNLAYLTADTDVGATTTSYSSTTAYIKVAF